MVSTRCTENGFESNHVLNFVALRSRRGQGNRGAKPKGEAAADIQAVIQERRQSERERERRMGRILTLPRLPLPA